MKFQNTCSMVLTLTVGLVLAACASTSTKKPSRTDEIQENVNRAFDQMVQRLVEQNGGALEGVRVAFVARVAPVEYTILERTFDLDNLGSVLKPEPKEGFLAVDNYANLVRSFAEERNVIHRHFQVYDRDALAAIMKSAGIQDANELFVPSSTARLREASVQSEPLDGLVLLDLSGVQESEDSSVIRWTLECRFSDIRAMATDHVAGFSRWPETIKTQSIYFEVPKPPPSVSTPAVAKQAPPKQPKEAGNVQAPAAQKASGEVEPNESLALAKPLAAPGSVDGVIGTGDTEDWFVIVAPSTGYLSVSMTNTKVQGADGRAPKGMLLTQAGQQLDAFGRMVHANASTQTKKQLVEAGATYYVRLLTADEERNVPYRLDVMFGPE